MSDEPTSSAPTSNIEQHDAGCEAPPATTAAPSAVPDAPPPSSDASPAGVSAPPADIPPGAAPGADASANTIVESQPVPEGTVTSPVIDTPADAAAALGAEGGVHPETIAEKLRAEEKAVEETVHDVIARIRARLHSMGQDVHDAFARDIEKLQNMV